MRLNAVLLSFYLAPVAWCTAIPIPIVLVDSLESVPVVPRGAHPPAPVAASRPKHALPQTIFLNDDVDDGSSSSDRNGVAIDNRPVTPSKTATPSTVLAAPQPVVTSYLLALARLSGFKRKFPAFYAAHIAEEDVDAIEASSIAQMELGVHPEPTSAAAAATAAKTAMPSYYPCVTRERGDMLAISLVAIFMFFVIIVETWPILLRR